MNPPSPLNPQPTAIQHYDILDCIGRGGMGLVYLARDTRLERNVAIKYLRTELFEPVYRERFKREALLLAKLNHPNIVQIYDFIEAEDQLALVMEYVDGSNLQVHLREHVVPLAQRVSWLIDIAQGLAVAHDAGIIHRDLKFENILINKHNVAKITDLGIAKSHEFNSTLTEHVTGSYCSMSPEQAKGDVIDFKSDLFSFGILAYQLLCGAHPFGDTHNKLQLMQRIILQPPTPPTNHNPNLPPEATELLGHLLSKDPKDRPANSHWLVTQCQQLKARIQQTSIDTDQTQALNHSVQNASFAGRNSRHTTQQHPTFDTRFNTKPAPITHKIGRYVKQHTLNFILACSGLLLIAGLTLWQLQPKPPRYIAVLPPTFTSSAMQESQQELVKTAVYDALQQGLLQLEGYHLIPRTEITEIDARNNKEGLETLRRATAADEIITTNVHCKMESCNIVISRLATESRDGTVRLKVKDSKTLDVLTYSYLSMATIVQNNIGSLYSEKLTNKFQPITEQEYAEFLNMDRSYHEHGASVELLDKLDKLQPATQTLVAVQNLYTDIALDLHYGTKQTIFLDRLNKNLSLNANSKPSKETLYNQYFLQIAKKDFAGAAATTTAMTQINPSSSLTNELQGYSMMAQKDYKSAISFYKKALATKLTTNNLYYISLAYWRAGDTASAKKYLQTSLQLSPNLQKSLSMYGIIELMAGNISSAQASFKKVEKTQPNDPYNISYLGLCHFLLQEYGQASALFDRAVILAPHNTYFKLNKADAENLQSNDLIANAIYTDIVASTPQENISNEELSSIAQAYAHLGNFSEALTTLQKLEKLDSQNIETMFSAALVHTLAKNDSSAILNIENSLKYGLNKIWFNFSWFDGLCKNKSFNAAMVKYGEPNRCAPHNNN